MYSTLCTSTTLIISNSLMCSVLNLLRGVVFLLFNYFISEAMDMAKKLASLIVILLIIDMSQSLKIEVSV